MSLYSWYFTLHLHLQSSVVCYIINFSWNLLVLPRKNIHLLRWLCQNLDKPWSLLQFINTPPLQSADHVLLVFSYKLFRLVYWVGFYECSSDYHQSLTLIKPLAVQFLWVIQSPTCRGCIHFCAFMVSRHCCILWTFMVGSFGSNTLVLSPQ